MRPEYRTSISDQYKRKIENIVRKPVNEEAQESLEVSSGCMYCGLTIVESQLDCPNCKNISPFCVVTGVRMTKEEWASCPSCRFPARREPLLALAAQSGELCPMCDTQIPADIP